MKAIVVLADGFEDIEAVTPIDIMRRASLDVDVVSLKKTDLVTGSRGVRVVTDCFLEDLDMTLIDALILPGGMPGSKNLSENEFLIDLIQKKFSENKLVAAICAAPALVLGKAGVLKDRKFTCYPGFEKEIDGDGYRKRSVVVDGNLVTGQGPGAAIDFGLTLVSELIDRDKAYQIAKSFHLSEEKLWV